MSTPIRESFSIQFEGPAFNAAASVPAAALGQSLLAFDGLLRKTAEAAYGPEAKPEIKVRAERKPGSFQVDLMAECERSASASALSAGASLRDVIALGKWAFGKTVKLIGEGETLTNHCVSAENRRDDTRSVDACTLNLYGNRRVQVLLSRLTQTLDIEGAERISIASAEGSPRPLHDNVTISKESRAYFRHEDGLVLTDSEAEVMLEVIGPMLDGSPAGWTFSEGEGGFTFQATVADEKFLSEVRNARILFTHGVSLRAILRMVQRKTAARLITDRTVVEVKEIIPAP